MTASRLRDKSYQIGLKSLLAILLILCAVLGLCVKERSKHNSLAQRAKSLEGVIEYSDEGIRDSVIVEFLLGKRVRTIRLADSDFSNEELEALVQGIRLVESVQELSFSGCTIPDRGVQLVSTCTSVKSLSLTRCVIPAEELRHIEGLSQLKVLSIYDMNLSNQNFDFLLELPELELLETDSYALTTYVVDNGLSITVIH